MSIIRVYRNKVCNPEHGESIGTEFPVYAGLEKIESLNARAMSSIYLDIEESHLSPDGFYYPSNVRQ